MRRTTILVVEDYEDTRQMLRVLLEECGYNVLEAEDGQAAISLVKEGCPDLILMDMSLPVVDGLTATRVIHETERCCRVPVIAVTAHHESEYKRKALEAGCVDFVQKPIDFSRLAQVISQHLAPV